MRLPLIAGLACAIAALPCAAQDATADKVTKALELALPASTEDCFKTLEAVLQRALDADLLDDQIDQAELHLDKLESACQDGKFSEALEEARALERILATNK